MSAAVTFTHGQASTGQTSHQITASDSRGLTPHARNPEVLSRTSHIPLMLQMHNRGEAKRAAHLAEGVLQRASMYIMNQAYTAPIPTHPSTTIAFYSLALGLTQAADALKYKASMVRREADNGR